MVDITKTTSGPLGTWRSGHLAGRVAKKRIRVINNAQKGIYYWPMTFKGCCEQCKHSEFWQQLTMPKLILLALILPVLFLVLAFFVEYKYRLYMLAMVPVSYFLARLIILGIQAVKNNIMREKIPKESLPSIFDSSDAMKESALKAIRPGEKPLHNKTTFAV